MKKLLAVLVGAAMTMTLVGAMGASAGTRPVLPVKAVVVNRHMVPGGVSVSLSAITSITLPKGAMYTWDFTNDGVFESPLRSSPDLTYVYSGPNSSSIVTATIKVLFPSSSAVYRDSVTFSLRLPFVHHAGPRLHHHMPILHGHMPILHGHMPILHGHMPILHGHMPILHG